MKEPCQLQIPPGTASSMLANMRSRNTSSDLDNVLPSVAVPTLEIVNVTDLWPGTVCERPDSIQLMGCVTQLS